MKSAHAILLISSFVLVFAAAAAAMDKDEMLHGPTAYVPEAQGGSRATGDDCSDPIVISALPYSDIGQTTCGRLNDYSNTCLNSYDGGEDIIYRLDIASATVVDITMNPGTTTWTGLVIDANCPPAASGCIAISTGSGGNRILQDVALAPGSYYIMVDTWPSPDCIPAFDLTITEAVPPPPNDICDGAIDLQEQGLTQFEIDLCAYTNNYNAAVPGPSCTGYSTNGPDATYKIYLTAGDSFMATQTGPYDSALWLVTDCANASATCVAGSDAGVVESISYVAAEDGWYYLLIDSYSGCGLTTVTIDSPVEVRSTTWGNLKALYN